MAVDQKKHEHTSGSRAIKIGALVLTILIAGAFVLEPVMRSINQAAGTDGSAANTLAYYKDTEIKAEAGSRFYRSYQNNLAFYRAYYGNEYVQSNIYAITQNILQSTIMDMARLEEMAKLEMPISAEKLEKQRRAYPDYQVDGRYSLKAYQNTPEFTRKSNIEIIKEQIRFTQFESDSALGYTENEAEKEFLLNMIKDQRSIRFVTFQNADYPDELVKEFGVENIDLFKQAQFSTITVKSLDDATNVKAELTAQNFADKAKEVSTDFYAQNGGANANFKFKYQLENTLSDSADIDSIFALSPGTIAGPFKTAAEDYVIYKLDTAIEEIDLEENLVAVRNYIQSNDASVISDYIEAKAESFAQEAREKGISIAAAAEGMQLKSADNVVLNYKNYSGFPAYTNSEIVTAAADEDFLLNLFAANDGDVLDPVVLGSSVLVAEVVAHTVAEDAELTGEYANILRQNHFTDTSRVYFNPDNYTIDQNNLISLIYN